MTTVLTKKDFIALVAEKTGESKAAVERILEAEKEIVLAETKAGNVVKTSLGKFKKVEVKAREGVNPQNPEKKIKIPAKDVLKFAVLPALKVL